MLTYSEIISNKLRELYTSYNYKLFRMTKFEEYDFYADKKDFLQSKHILSFTDINGKLMALRPDVTLSLIKNYHEGKFCYRENVYRVPENQNSFREIPQAGIEYLGCPDVAEVMLLALKSLEIIADGKNYILDVADGGIVAGLLHDNYTEASRNTEILHCLASKNIHGLKDLHADEKLVELAGIDGNPENSLACLTPENALALKSLRTYYPHLRIDFSCVNSLKYYSGIIFRGYAEGFPKALLSGGMYDIMNTKGCGFAVYLSELEREINS